MYLYFLIFFLLLCFCLSWYTAVHCHPRCSNWNISPRWSFLPCCIFFLKTHICHSLSILPLKLFDSFSRVLHISFCSTLNGPLKKGKLNTWPSPPKSPHDHHLHQQNYQHQCHCLWISHFSGDFHFDLESERKQARNILSHNYVQMTIHASCSKLMCIVVGWR